MEIARSIVNGTGSVNDGLKLVENQRSEIGGRRGLTG